MKKLLLLILAFSTILVGCQINEPAKKQMQTYINQKAGYVVLIPHDWQKKFENDVTTGFVGQEPNVALDIVFEVGGFDYHSLDSLGEVVIKNLKTKLKDVKIIEKDISKANNNAYRVILQGKTPGGNEVIVKTIFFEPAVGIRYYMAFASNPKDYYANDYLFEDIAQSFQMTKSENDLYKQLKNREEEQFKKEHSKEMKEKKAKEDKEKKENQDIEQNKKIDSKDSDKKSE